MELAINNDYKYFVIQNDSIKIHRNDSIVKHSGDLANGLIIVKGKYGSKQIIYFKKGRKTKKNYFLNDSIMTSQYHYEQNKIDGKYTEWYTNGSLKMKGQYHKGKADSLWMYYYQNGNIQAKGFFNSIYKADKIEFTEHSFDYSIGLVSEVIYTSNDYAFDGTWKFYDQEGEITQELEFTNGKITSFHIGKLEY